MAKLWGGRYSGVTDELMWTFNASIDFDRRLAQADIRGSIAYAHALAKAEVISDKEADTLEQGLLAIADAFRQGTFAFQPMDEDIHTAVERRLGELAGPVAGKLHTGRSRNDQVATDVRLFLVEALGDLDGAISELQTAIVQRAEELIDVIMAGYTHMQPAQPIRFSHWLMSFFWMLQRDRDRLRDSCSRCDACPLGAGALAGNVYGIDRQAIADELGFARITANSMDAVSDRDMILETLNAGAMLGLHLSRLAEDLIIWSSREFGFVALAERYTTGSSIMPQKRNPDSMELVRGKSGRLVGNLSRLLTVCKGIPSTYDKDLQEDKEPLFDTLDTLAMLLPIVTGVVSTLQVNETAMAKALDQAMLATDLADYLVKRGMPFREAHGVVGRAVLLSEERGQSLGELTWEDWQALSPLFERDVAALFDFEASVELRDVPGGTARAAVLAQIAEARALL